MDVHSGEDGRTRRTAHGRCGVGLREVGAPVLHEVHQLRHVVERTYGKKANMNDQPPVAAYNQDANLKALQDLRE